MADFIPSNKLITYLNPCIKYAEIHNIFLFVSDTATDSIYVKRILILGPSCPPEEEKKSQTKKFSKLFRYLANICYNVRITLARTMLTHHFLFFLTNFVVNRERKQHFFYFFS